MIQKSLSKALQILDSMAIHRGPCSITELGAELSLNKSNVHDILATFEHFGYVTKDPVTRRYSLSMRFIELAHSVGSGLGIQDLARARVHQLANDLSEVVYFGIPHGDHVLYLEGGSPGALISTHMVTGMTAPMYCTGIGKAMLAFLPDEDRERILALPRQAFTDHTLVGIRELRADLARTRAQGYSVDNMEHELGVKCVAVPVLGKDGEVLGALSVTGPSLRFPDEVIGGYAATLRDAAARIAEGV
ncbi:MAG: IclR family transcriptional regulator [Succinivibrionaceae bacterium]|nr:IclR family transcriptional regulator [Succinivibrionaceae bacterium]